MKTDYYTSTVEGAAGWEDFYNYVRDDDDVSLSDYYEEE